MNKLQIWLLISWLLSISVLGQQAPERLIEVADGDVYIEEIDPLLNGTQHGLRLSWILEEKIKRGESKVLTCYNNIDTNGDGSENNPGFSVILSCVHVDECEPYQVLAFIWSSILESQENPTFGGTIKDLSSGSNSGPDFGILPPHYTSRWSYNQTTYRELGFGFENPSWQCWWNNEPDIDALNIVELNGEEVVPLDLCTEGWESNNDWCGGAPTEEEPAPEEEPAEEEPAEEEPAEEEPAEEEPTAAEEDAAAAEEDAAAAEEDAAATEEEANESTGIIGEATDEVTGAAEATDETLTGESP